MRPASAGAISRGTEAAARARTRGRATARRAGKRMRIWATRTQLMAIAAAYRRGSNSPLNRHQNLLLATVADASKGPRTCAIATGSRKLGRLRWRQGEPSHYDGAWRAL